MPDSSKIFVANWKENKDFAESTDAFCQILRLLSSQKESLGERRVVVCPSFPLLYALDEKLRAAEGLGHTVFLGAQDVSSFEGGAYTGEVSARLISGMVRYVIVGHSERKRHFGETLLTVNQKILVSRKFGITPIVCVSREEDIISLKAVFDPKTSIVAYEPVDSIGTGRAAMPYLVTQFRRLTEDRLGSSVVFLYGGSVSPDNAADFFVRGGVDGFLVGGSSLNPREFVGIIFNS